MTTPFKVLFVCMGNICRSPTAEGIFKAMVKEAGLEEKIQCDSAGTIGFHEGSPPDRRMTDAARKKNYFLEGSSRRFDNSDFNEFNLIVVMDKENYQGIVSLTDSMEFINKTVMMCDYATHHDDKIVPDPYYGGKSGFDYVVDLLEDACRGLLDTIIKNDFK